jgi:hypothetical protein
MGPTPVIRLNYSGIRLGRSYNHPQLAVPWNPVEVVNAAEKDIHDLRLEPLLTANNKPQQQIKRQP